jgi:hypothetical protein
MGSDNRSEKQSGVCGNVHFGWKPILRGERPIILVVRITTCIGGIVTNKRIAIFANKWWETDPLCAVLLHDRARPSSFEKYSIKRYPTFRVPVPRDPSGPPPLDPPAIPRLSFECGTATVEVWCTEEIMNPIQNSSSSLEKARVLQPVLTARPGPSLVIAFGTAAAPNGVSANGSVVIGRRVFVHDPTPQGESRTGKWQPPYPDKVLDSTFPEAAFKKVRDQEQARYAAEARFLKSPVAPTNPPLVLLGNGFISVGVVNITNYDDYIWADRSAVDAFLQSEAVGQIGSIDTTHGVVRSLTQAPFIYVSGIADTEGSFDYQVTPRPYAQNFVAAHNAAIALAWLIPDLVSLL